MRHPPVAGKEPVKIVKQSVFHLEFLLIKSKLFPSRVPSHLGEALPQPHQASELRQIQVPGSSVGSLLWMRGSVPQELAFQREAAHDIPEHAPMGLGASVFWAKGQGAGEAALKRSLREGLGSKLSQEPWTGPPVAMERNGF